MLGTRKTRDADPLYGTATAATITQLWPGADDIVDFGIDAMAARLDDLHLAPMLAPRPDAPVLMPAYIALWAHTSPRPAADPEPALFLHGADREPASVQIVWRDDLDLRLEPTRLHDLLALTPPCAGEVLELPVWAARQWLRGPAPDLADVAEPDRPAAPVTNLRAYRWAGPDDARSGLIEAKDVRPGDLLIVPSERGGCDAFGWSPDDTHPVPDVFDAASERAGGRQTVVRIAPGRYAGIAAALEALGDTPRGSEVIDAITDLLPPDLAARLATLPRRTVRAFFPYKSGDAVILVAPRPPAERTGDATTGDDDASVHASTAQTLRGHTALVEATVHRFATGTGLSPALTHDLVLAARLHDAGKADPRFQRLLTNAGPFGPTGSEALAKSAKGVSAPGGSAPGTWARARLPDQWRHEALSVRLAMAGPLIGQAHDRALVLYLVGVHHGFGRPFFPHTDDADAKPRMFPALDAIVPTRLEPGAGPQALDFVLEAEAWDQTARDPNDLRGLDWFTMIRELHARYGAWGLARLEATLRLADHRASAEGDTTP